MRTRTLAVTTVVAGMAAFLLQAQGLTREARDAMTPAQALALLEQGNARFAAGKREHRDYSAELRASAANQYPFAAVVSCMDSRAPAEILFDRGIGEMFSLRGAGPVIDDDVLGGLEFATRVMGVKLIVVLGHSNCGAVKGAIDGAELGHLTQLLAKIQPVIPKPIPAAKSKDDAFVARVAEANVRNAMKEIPSRSPVIQELLQSGKVRLAGGMYDLTTGKVTFYRD